ncbi:MAG: hypothetical protein ACOYN3_02270, partial [Acidimicrobiia bacterium]
VPGPWNGPRLEVDHSLISLLSEHAAHGTEIALDGQVPSLRSAEHMVAASNAVARERIAFGAYSDGDPFDGVRSAQTVAVEALQRNVAEGCDRLRALGFAPVGLMSPSWQLPSALAVLLEDDGLTYATSHFGVYSLSSHSGLALKSFAYRPGAPRGPVDRHGVEELAQFAKAAGMPIRIALFPEDARDRTFWDARLRTIDTLLDWGFTGMTHAAIAALPPCAVE